MTDNLKETRLYDKILDSLLGGKRGVASKLEENIYTCRLRDGKINLRAVNA